MLLGDMRFVGLLALIALAAAGAGAAAQTAPGQETAAPVFPVRSDLVVLHVLVKDRDGNHVSGLPADAFAVWEENRPQTIQFFDRDDTPVTVGLVVDVSGSMYGDRQSVVAAAKAFLESSRPGDELFAMVFDQRVRAVLPSDRPFTDDAAALGGALANAIAAGGWTALHDAVALALRHAKKGQNARKALVVVGDGGDNASAASFRELLTKVEASDTTIYTVALVNPVDPFANPGRLRQLARASGGEAFQPRSLRDVENAFRRVAFDVRAAYTIGYAPARPAEYGEHRRIRLIARALDGRTLTVQTRQGYVVEKP